MIGQTISHYKITDKIGAGGMGEVYRATDSKLHRDVAIKVISESLSSDRDTMARFEREAQVLASLTHGSIAAVYGIEESNGQRAIIMELVEGEDLSHRLRNGPLPLGEALRTALHIAEALEAAHERGVIHRDLKPGNIKVLDTGAVKLLDFGLAKALEEAGPAHLTKGDAATLSVAATRAGIILGTAAYMSPEQATGAAADKRSDVWSFGVVLFEMLTGRRLFEGETTSLVLAEVIRAEIDFSRLPENLPPDLRTLIERSLERDPRRRLRDMREARLVLERLLERGTGAHTVLRSGPMVVSPAVRSWRQRLPQVGLAALIVGLLGVAAAGWMRPAPTSAPQLRVAVRVAEGALFASVGPAFDLSPDGRQIAMVTGDPSAPNSAGLVVRRLNELDSTALIAPGSNADVQVVPYNPFFSPDGEWVGYAVPGELRKIPTSGGTPLTICKVSRSRGASWGADGTIVFAASPNSGLSRVSAAGGEPQALTTLNADAKEATHRWPQILPGGAAVLFTSHTSATGTFDDAVIEVVTIATGERRVVQRGGAFARYVPSGHLVYAHNNTLLAVPFDVKQLAVTGPVAPVVQNVTVNAVEGVAQFAFASTGLMAYMQGASELPVFPIAWVDRSGMASTLLGEPGTYANPRLSPDGKRLSLTVHKNKNWDIWVYDLERRISTRVTFDETAETEQVWSPDGRDLVFTADGVQGPQTIFRKPADGSGTATPLHSGTQGLWVQSWAPDGQTLAMTSAEGDVGVISPSAGKDAKPSWILNSRFNESDPAFSPDGRWLAYASRESGQSEIYVRRFPSGSGRWQVSSGGGAFPRWAGNGRELYYRSATGVMVATIEPEGESLRTGTPRELFKGPFLGGLGGMELGAYVFADFDVSADGSRFVMFPKPVDKVARTAGMITLVSNWFDDVSRATQPK